MFGFVRRRWFWLIVLGVLTAGAGGAFFMNQAEAKKTAEVQKAEAKAPESPSRDRQRQGGRRSGIIQVAARRGGVVEAGVGAEGDTSGRVRSWPAGGRRVCS
jgi:hypothetical protein